MAAPPPTRSPAMGSPATTEIRNATNLRTVVRNDPAAAEILATSTYSVIYHYNADLGKWEKQKQEGSLFIVRRTKAPEYCLFMLNRVIVKNVSIPLLPGEMKATAIDASMLQVARRGEKIKYGIWFTEGTEGVQRFRDTIIRVCGEPSKAGAPSQASLPQLSAVSAPAPVPGPSATGAPVDDLSRLFASISTVPARPNDNSPQPYPQPQSQPQPQLYPQGQPPVPSPPAPGNYASPPNPTSPPQQRQQAAAAAPYAPGQTVDDLLQSILGGPTKPPAPVAPVASSYSSPPPPMPGYPSAGLNGMPMNGPPPFPPAGYGPPPGVISGPCAPGPISNFCAPHPSSLTPQSVPTPPPHVNGAAMAMNPNAHPNMHMGMNVPRPTGPNDVGAQQLSAATARAIPTSAAAPSPVAPAPPDFRAFLADLVTQPYNSWFADQVFAAYTQDLERDAKRRSSPPQQPGQQQQVPVQPQQMQPQPQPQQQAQQAQQQQGQSQGQRRGGRPPRGRNQ